MGADFLGRTRKTISKHIDRRRVELATSDLFTVTPNNCPRTYVATIAAGRKVVDGESLIAEIQDGCVMMRRGNDIVVFLDRPPNEIVVAIDNSGGLANGVVQRVHKLSGKVDVTLC